MTTNVAIACQGGGSHSAFGAGVLQRALPWIEAHDARLVGLSGTSGGALSAVTAWFGSLTGGADRAVELLDDVWADVVASSPVERTVNDWAVWWMQARNNGLPVPAVSPYAVPWSERGEEWFLDLLRRHVDFERFPELATPAAPRLLVGTVDVAAGEFETFEDGAVTAEAVLASAAVPTIFEAVELHGHGHWDGLFARNPPITDLVATGFERRPDELWIVQINPQRTDGVPKSRQAIADRRRELTANVSLNEQAEFVRAVNRWVRMGDLPRDRYKHVEVRKLILERDFSLSSKLERTRRFVEEVTSEGRDEADALLETVEADLG